MFWEGISTESSSLIALLESKNFTLDDLLLDEFFLQEFDVCNADLLEFLLKPETVEEIIKHITTEPPPELEDKIRFKKAHVACGLFAHGYNKIENVIVSHEHLFNKLIQFLEQPTPLHPLLASFFTKSMSGCLQKHGKQTLKLFQKRTDMFDLLVKHIETSAIMDLIEIFFSVTRQIDLDKEDEQWLNESDFPHKLLQVFTPERSVEAHENAGAILSRLIEFYRHPQFLEFNERFNMLNTLESKEFSNKLLTQILSKPTPSLVINGLNVILSLLDCINHIQIITLMNEGKTIWSDVDPKRETEFAWRFFDCVLNIQEAVVSHLPALKNLLINPIETNPIQSTVGLIEQPFGVVRLKIFSVIRSIFITNSPKVNIALKEHQIFPLTWDLFFKYPWNNFVHNFNEQFFSLILTNLSPNTRQFIHLLDNRQANSTRLDENDSVIPCTDQLQEPTLMEITTLESTNANSTEMEITITEVHSEIHPQPSLFEILSQLLVQNNLLQKIIKEVRAAKQHQESKSTQPYPAYIGHLTEIANLLEDSMKCHDFIRIEFEKMLDPLFLDEWKKFVAQELSQLNEKNSTAIGKIRSEKNYKPVEFETEKGMLEHTASFLTKTLQPSFSIFENDNPNRLQLRPENYDALDVSLEEKLANSNESLKLFEKFCNERLKPIILSEFLEDEHNANHGDATLMTDSSKKIESTDVPSLFIEECNSMTENNSSNSKDDNSAHQMFFQPKASSSNLSSELRMEIDPFLEIPNAGSFENQSGDMFDSNSWNAANPNQDNESWADFSSFEKIPEPNFNSVSTEMNAQPANEESNGSTSIVK